MVLAIIGTIWLLYGLGMLTSGPVTVAGAAGVWHLTLDPTLRGSLWAGTGILAIYTAASRPRTDTPGFLALAVGPMIYSFSYLVSYLVYVLPLASPGYSGGLVGALSWVSVITLIAVIASWPEPVRDHGPILPPASGGDRE